MNTKKKKKNRIILCLCSILVLFASVFAVIPFNKETHVVKADTLTTSYNFQGSDVFTMVSAYNNDDYDSNWTISLSFGFSTDLSGSVNQVRATYYWLTGGSKTKSVDVSSSSGTIHIWNGSYNCFFNYQIVSDDGFKVGVPIGVEISGGVDAYRNVSTSMRYFDENDNGILFSWEYRGDYSMSVDNFPLDYREYYFFDSLTDNSIYIQGFNEGKAEGASIGRDQGYREGFEAGEDSGYWDGYEQAIENNDRYSFTNLISAVIDVPVKTFTSLFNFEILGVNLSGFFLGLLTCCIVIGVIRLIL